MAQTTQNRDEQEKTMGIKVEHTPGEWEAHGSMIDCLTPEGNQVTIASVNSCWRKMGNEESNAHLIAAAPNMLDALKSAEEELQFLYSNANRSGGRILERVRAAIKKAEGAK